MGLRLSAAARNAARDTGHQAWLNAATTRLSIFTGAQPAAGGDAMTGTKLSEHSVSAVADGTDGQMTFTFSASTVAALATGTAASFVLWVSTDTVPTSAALSTDERITGTVGTSGADLNFDSVSFTSGGNITISSFSLTVPAA